MTGGASSVSTAVLVIPSYTALMMAAVEPVTAVVVTVKVALLLPLAIVTLAGTVADDESELNATVRPPTGAGALKVSVPWEVGPPVTLVGLIAIVLRLAGGASSVRTAVLVIPSYTALMVAAVEPVTAVVATVKVALLLPLAIVTLAGTVADAESELSATARPPLGAVALKVTVP